MIALTRASTLERILVPHDGSQLSQGLVRWICSMAAPFESRITVVRVIPRDANVIHERVAHRELMKDLHRLGQERLTLRPVIDRGDPADAILRRTEDPANLIELIAMGTQARGALRRLFQGSQAEAVLGGTSLPVVLANPTAARREPGIGLRRLLVAVDGSARADPLLPWVALLALAHEAHVTLVHVLPAAMPVVPAGAGVPARPPLLPEPSQGVALLEPIRDRLRQAGVAVTARVLRGRVEAELVAASRGHDLLAVCARRTTGIDRLLLGSVSRTLVRRADCPTLVVPTPREG